MDGTAKIIEKHRVGRVLGFFSSPPNWEPPPPHPQASVFPYLGSGGGGPTRLQERGWGSEFGQGDRHCGTLGKYEYVLCAVASSRITECTYALNQKLNVDQYKA